MTITAFDIETAEVALPPLARPSHQILR